MRFPVALDPAAETKRQFLTLVIWMFFLASAVVGAVSVGTHVPGLVDPLAVDPGEDSARTELRRSRMARLRIALLLGLVAPAACTVALRRRHRRLGGYARGITVELTDVELRLWGRGYGTRVAVAGSELDERLVDVYAGRLGAWRQVRLRVRSKVREIELAAPALESDLARGLRLEGGEADCVELERADYDSLKSAIAVQRQDAGLRPNH